jgi:hypothetical protein
MKGLVEFRLPEVEGWQGAVLVGLAGVAAGILFGIALAGIFGVATGERFFFQRKQK